MNSAKVSNTELPYYGEKNMCYLNDLIDYWNYFIYLIRECYKIMMVYFGKDKTLGFDNNNNEQWELALKVLRVL